MAEWRIPAVPTAAGRPQPGRGYVMGDEQERHEQLMYRFREIEMHILRADTRSIDIDEKVRSIESKIKEIYELIFLMGPTILAIWMAYRWLGDAATWILGSLVGSYLGFRVLRALWRTFRTRA
jgi:hypothetical protein